MNITLLNVGKTNSKALEVLIDEFEIRLKKYVNYNTVIIPPPKNAKKLNPEELKKAEGELIIKKTGSSAQVILLDERGKEYNSFFFANYIQKLMNSGAKHIYFVTGGAYGFSEEVYQRANAQVSLSKMTTTHQLVRLFFTEQLYRALTILNNHPYHNN